MGCHTGWSSNPSVGPTVRILAGDGTVLGRMWGLDYGGDHEIKAGATQVPTFYSGITTASEYILPLSAGMAIAMVFGGIHCVAWSFQPPSHAEQLLWRISSLTITCIPALEFVSMVINANPSAMWVNRLSWGFLPLYWAPSFCILSLA